MVLFPTPSIAWQTDQPDLDFISRQVSELACVLVAVHIELFNSGNKCRELSNKDTQGPYIMQSYCAESYRIEYSFLVLLMFLFLCYVISQIPVSSSVCGT